MGTRRLVSATRRHHGGRWSSVVSVSYWLAMVVMMMMGGSIRPVEAHESCCKFKAAQQNAEPEFIPDPDDLEPPREWRGQARFVDDPNDHKPGYWDDEDDGEWKPARIPNPAYAWEPRTIPNPKYVPPPTYRDKLRVEILAATPWVTLGVLITGTLSLALPASTEAFLRRCLRDGGNGTTGLPGRLFRLALAGLLGLAVPLCSCGALPLCAGLLRAGIPLSLAVAFLTASQSAGLDSAAVTLGLLGVPAMVGRLLGALLLAVAVGLACPSSTPAPRAGEPTKDSLASSPAPTLSGWLVVCAETAREVFPSVVLGLVLSTAVLHHLPSLIDYDHHHSDEGVSSSLAARLVTLASAVPLQLCEHTSVTLAAAIQKAGFSPGLAFAFLLSAPSLNLPSLLLLLGASSSSSSASPWWVVARVVLALSGSALALSYAVDALGLDLLAGTTAGEMALLPARFVDASPFLGGGLYAAGVVLRKRSSGPPAECGGDCCPPPANTGTATKPKEE